MKTDTSTGGNAPAAPTAGGASTLEKRVSKLESLLAERHTGLPVWVRAPKSGHEFYTGFSRSKLYELAASKSVKSVSIRERGQIKGTRLFLLESVLNFISSHE